MQLRSLRVVEAKGVDAAQLHLVGSSEGKLVPVVGLDGCHGVAAYLFAIDDDTVFHHPCSDTGDTALGTHIGIDGLDLVVGEGGHIGSVEDLHNPHLGILGGCTADRQSVLLVAPGHLAATGQGCRPGEGIGESV